MCSYPGNSTGAYTGFLPLPPATAQPQLDAFTSACHASSAILVPAPAFSPRVCLVEGMWLTAHLMPPRSLFLGDIAVLRHKGVHFAMLRTLSVSAVLFAALGVHLVFFT